MLKVFYHKILNKLIIYYGIYTYDIDNFNEGIQWLQFIVSNRMTVYDIKYYYDGKSYFFN